MSKWLTEANGYAFRIMHVENLPAALVHGIFARNAVGSNPHYKNIGNTELISKRGFRPVPVHPFGVLNDYVPFYFTSHSPMALNIKTGYNVPQRPNDEIIIFVAQLDSLAASGLQVVFTDRHAYLQAARYFTERADLCEIDWEILQARNFRRDPNDPERMDRYQAELLVHTHVPIAVLNAIVTYSPATPARVQEAVQAAGCDLKVRSVPGMYF